MAEQVKFGRSLFGWVLFIGLAVMLFMLLSRSQTQYASIPLGRFTQLLKGDRVAYVDIDKDRLVGEFRTAEDFGDRRVLKFQVQLPAGTTANWAFTNWLLNNAENAGVGVEGNGQDVLLDIVKPLIPWLLIFGFIWFFVFRQFRNQAKNAKEQPPVKVFVVNQPGGEDVPLANEVKPS